MTKALEAAEGSASRCGRSSPGKDPVPIVQEAGWAPGPVWTGTENLAPTGIRSRTVQPVASRYTDYATRSTEPRVVKLKLTMSEPHKNYRLIGKKVRAVPGLCGLYPGNCLTTEEKARKNLSQGK